ncbi:Ig-like domain-containing protein [Methylomonas sp. HW2-6]|uniref:Ig-like domain-containing protein n=1 Tax=Methylomonas sp. HW2-6 TaxID=3376687 RepID=UPI004040FFC3
MNTQITKSFSLLTFLLGLIWQGQAAGNGLDQNCVVNILNRTVQVNKDGGWAMPNVPSQMGRVRARATCTILGDTFSGESEYFNVVQNGIVNVPEIKFQVIEPIPVSLKFTEPSTETLISQGATAQLIVDATYRDGTVKDISASSNGTNYTSSNPAIVSVDSEGLVTAVSSGSVLITARKDEVVAFKRINVVTTGDADDDGLPDDFEIANGLNPNDPLDALEDPDNDGLTTKQEYQAGTNFRLADSDGDGLSDGVEVSGSKGYVTDPLKADTDGDGVNDNDEIIAGYNPTDGTDGGGRNYVELVVSPANPTMTFNTVYNEANLQVKVSGKRGDGSLVDLTAKSTGTTYSSSNLSVVSFGAKDGLLFAGQSGTANLTVRNGGLEKTVTVTIGTFNPTALSSIAIPGYANNVDVAGDYAYVAAGSKGLQILNVANRSAPSIVGSLDTAGTAIDVRVVGNLVYLADGDHGLQIIDVTDPTAPSLMASYETAGIAQDVKIDNQFAYIADGNNGLEIVDVRKPNQPLFAGALSGLGETKGVDVQGTTLVAVAGSSLHAVDITDKTNPLKKGSLSIGPVKDVVLKDGYAYVAAYSSGWKVVDVRDAGNPVVIGGDANFVPRDIELTDGFAFAAEQLFPNVTAYVNIEDPENAVFQGTIDLSRLGDYAGTGIALDSNYVYVTEEAYVVGQDYGSDGNTRLFIAQYRLTEDKGGVAPTIEISEPPQDTVVVEGKKITITANADDDIGVKSVSFLMNGEVVYTDTSRPYQYPVSVPFGTVGSTISITARAVDFGGNQTTTPTLTLTVQADTDRDGLSDEQEAIYGTNAADPDTDDDGIKDGDEVDMYTSPTDADSDNDGIEDGVEVQKGTDPLNPDVTPPTVNSTSPANEATDIPENNPIIVTFAEPLQAKSINTDSISVYQGLLEGAAKVGGRVRLSSDGLQLIFTPSDILADYTDYKVVVDGVRDRAGNPIASPHSFHYKTGNTVDTTPPTVAAVDPNSNSSNVPVNVVVGVRFSEPVHTDSVNDQSVLLYDSVTGQQVLGVVTLNGDGQSATFVPNQALAVGRQHRIALTNAIKDLFGNSLNYSNYYFTTSFDKDASGPKITAFSVGADQASVPTNGVLQVRFDEPVSGLSLGGVELRKGGDVIAVTRELSGDRRTLTLKLQQPLQPNTGYSLHVEGVEDLSGNVLASAEDRSFTSGAGADLQGNGLAQYSPANGATGIGLNVKPVLTFNDRLNPLAVNSDTIALYDTATGQRPSVSYSVSADGKTVTLTPSAALTASRQYRVYISNWASLTDQAGNGIGWTYWTFTTGTANDQEAPLISGQNIQDGATGIAVNSKLRFVLDEAVSPFSLSGSVHLQLNGVEVAGTAVLGSDNRTITFTPSSALAVNTEYSIVLDGLYDYIGNRLAAVTSRFTTSSSATADTTGPSVVITPASGSTGVSATAPIVFSFNEEIDSTSLDSGIYVQADGFSGNVAGTLSRNGSIVTFTPLVAFPGNTRIWAYANGVQDIAGNSSGYRYSYFNTGTGGDTVAPQLVSITPNDGAMDVYGNNPIVLSFSESLNRSTVNSNSVGLFVNGNIVRPSISFSGDNRTVTLNYNLPASSVVTVLLTNDIKDLSGNRLADAAKVFATAADVDTARPSIVTALPGNGAYNVLSKNKIVLYSNEALKATSLPAALHVSQNGVLIKGTPQLLGDGRTLVFTPEQPWAKAAYIEVFLDSTAQDQSGNALNSFHSQFRIEEDPAQKAPYVIATGWSGSKLNPVLDLQFNEALDPASVSNSTFALRYYYYGAEIPTTVSLLKGNRVVRLQPTELLQTNRGYQIGIRAGVKDASGVAATYNSDYVYYYSTAADALEDTVAPKVTALSPADGAEQVGINNRISMRFDESVNPISFLSDDPDLPLAQVPNYNASTYSLNFSDSNRQVTYIPHEPWPADSDVTVAVDKAEDYAGNLVTPLSHTFHTANGPDTAAPAVVEWSMAESATDVPVNAVLKVRLNEAIDPVSVTDSSFYLYDYTTGAHVAATRSLSDDGRTLILVPEQALAVSRNYRLYVYYVQDMNGNSEYDTRYFTTAIAADNTAPQVSAYSVEADQASVPTNGVLQVRFDEPVSGLSLGGVELRKGGDVIAVTRELSGDRRTLTLKLQQPLQPNTGYSLHVEGVEDLSGNVLASAEDRSFTSGVGADLQGNGLAQYSPANGATGIGLNVKPVLTFNDRLNPLAVNSDTIALYDTATGQRPSVSYSVSADGKTVTLTPSAALTASRQYRVYISNWASLTDQAGNGIGWTYWTFTTGTANDQEAPLISGQNIQDGATGIAVNSKLRFVLDEAVSPFSLSGSVHLQLNGVEVAGTAVLGSDNRTITFTPSSALAVNTEYSIVLDGLYDYIGNRLAAVTSRFTTSSSATADTTGPSVVITPASGSTGVSATAPIVFSFNEEIDSTSLDSGIYVQADGFSGNVAGTLSRNGSIVTFTPLVAFPGNTRIWAYANGVQDIAGNSSGYRYSYFNTGTGGDTVAPQLVSITPNDGAMDVYGNNPIVLSFSESLNRSTVNSNSVGLFVNGNIVRPSISFSGDNRTVTLNYNLPASSVVTVLLTNDIKDLSGNRLADAAKVFATAADVDTARPSIVTALPGNGAYNVLSKNKIVLYSNEALKATSLPAALHVSQNGVLIKGTPQLLGDGRTLVFTPEQPWAKAAYIEVFLDSTAQDQSGNALNSFHSQFRIEEDPAQKAPYVIATGWSGSKLNPVLDLQFNEALDPASVSNSTFALRYYYYGAEIPTTVSLLKGNRVVRLQPTELLQTNRGYQIGIRAGVKDASGVAATYNSDYVYYYSTAADALEDTVAPKVTALSPADGAEQVGINNRISMRFDESVNPISFLSDDPDLPLAQVPNYNASTYSLNFSDSNRQVTYIPHEPWPADSDVTVAVDKAEDYAGNLVTPLSHTFHTANGPDTAAPAVVEWSMAESATDVPVNAVLKVRLNEAIDPVSVTDSSFYLYDYTTGAHVAATRSLSDDGRTLILVPEQALAVSRNYRLYVYYVQDMNGNSEYDTRYFTTAIAADNTAPQVSAYSVEADQASVPTNGVLQVRFDEPVSGLSLGGVELRKGGDVIAVTRELSGDRRTLTLKLQQPLQPNTGYSLHVEGVEDLSGNVLASAEDRSFTSGVGADLQGNGLAQYSPANGATGIGLNVKPVLTFNDRLNPLAVNSDTIALYDTATGQRPSVSYSVSADGKTVTLTPSAALTASRQYRVYISNWASLTDQAGNGIGWTYWTFTTGVQ